MRTTVELILARIDGDRLRYLVTRHPCGAHTDPDRRARSAMVRMFRRVSLRRAVVHSTSWRYDDGLLILTYLGYSDALPVGDLPLLLPLDAPVTGAGVSVVAAHAVRHLAFLTRQDAVLRARLAPEAISYLDRCDPELAGRINARRAA
jgi:hypothetical protein